MERSFGIILTFLVTGKISLPLAPKDPNICLIQVTTSFDHGEGPHWDERNNRLYFVDAYVGRVHCLESITNEMHSMQFEGDTTAVFTVENDKTLLIVANNRSLLGVKWSGRTADGYKRTVLAEVDKDRPKNRFNDGKVDSRGRLWIGTMASEDPPGTVKADQGRVYRVNQPNEKQLHVNAVVMIPKVTISNGFAWNNDSTVMYYIDSASLKVVAYEFDVHDGTLGKSEVVFDFSQNKKFAGIPDGMTIDQDDNLWVALYGGGCIVQINPRGKMVMRIISIPSRYVTSVIFGGNDLTTLYVTTSRRLLTEDERKWQPSAGAVFAIKGIPPGRPGNHANILSAEALEKINCKKNDSDLWCKPAPKLPN